MPELLRGGVNYYKYLVRYDFTSIYYPLLSGLLLGTLGCSTKQDDPVPAPSPTADGYVLDGKVVNCTTKCATSTNPVTDYDYLYISLYTSPAPSSGTNEVLALVFSKHIGEPTSAYKLELVGNMALYQWGRVAMSFTGGKYTLATTSSGGFSGTFTGYVRNLKPDGTFTVEHTITAGSFTDVQP